MMSEWQPIETAPKDGTSVLLWWPFGNKEIVIGRTVCDEWFSEMVLSDLDEMEGPTHWQPLPAPPELP